MQMFIYISLPLGLLTVLLITVLQKELLDFSKTNLTFPSLPTSMCFVQKEIHEKVASA